jgi:hypothetical protein
MKYKAPKQKRKKVPSGPMSKKHGKRRGPALKKYNGRKM